MIKKKILAVIPARGGSKRIPQKNIIKFFGKPIIYFTIKAAQESGLFSRIFVSTDSIKIAKIAEKFNIEVPFLRDKYYDDNASVHQAVISTIKEIEEQLKEYYDIVILLMPNCPLRNENQIISAYKNFLKKEIDFQISVFKFGWMNPWWAMKSKNEIPKLLFPVAYRKRSQDLDDLYCPTGAIWIAKIDKLKEHRTFYGPGFRTYPINWKYAIDIDNYEDLEMAKCIYHLINNDQKNK